MMGGTSGVSIATLKNFLGVVMLASLFFSALGFAIALAFVLSGLGLTVLTIAGPKSSLPIEGLPFVGFAAFTVMSTLWSTEPMTTLWTSLEYLVTVVIAVWAPLAIRPRAFVLTLFLSACVMGAECVPDLLRSASSGSPMIGVFASKNANASEAELWGFISSYIMLDKGFPAVQRALAFLAILVALIFVFYSHAMGSTVSLGLFFVLMSAGLGYRAVPPKLRLIALAAFVPIIVAAIMVMPELRDGWQEFQQTVLQKDSTMTGRTFIWDTADQVSREHPWLGVGFGAFWTPGNPYAEGIWQTFGITGRSGFNFHNVFVEYRVALGLIGLVGISMLYIYVGVIAVYNFLTRPSVFTVFIFAFLTCVYVHSFSEDGIGSPFNFETVFWIAIPRMLQVARRLEVERDNVRQYFPGTAKVATPTPS